MSLFFLLTVITFIDAYKYRIISKILKLIPQDSRASTIVNKIKAMEKDLHATSIVDEFSKYVKLQRKINKLQEEKKEIVKERAFKLMKIKYSLYTTTYVLVLGSLIALAFVYRSETVARVPATWLWPFSSFFDWSYYVPGSITVPCWIAISSSASKVLAKHF